MIKELKIKGLRGFASEQHIIFSMPNGKKGGGLSFIVGPNNSGKSTIVEALKGFTNNNPPTYSENKRNKKADDMVMITLVEENKDHSTKSYTIKTVDQGGTNVNRTGVIQSLYIIPSRRAFNNSFGNNQYDKNMFFMNTPNDITRKSSLQSFEYRITDISKKSKDKFDEVLFKLLGEKVEWTIDEHENNQFYIKIGKTYSHSSEGVGDGVISCFVLAAYLIDCQVGQTLVVDEPELSLHPIIQQNLIKLLMELSCDRQIFIATHSPYLINWESIRNGASVIRSYKEENECKIKCANKEIMVDIANAGLGDINFPHLLGITANEVFFLKDNIVLLEGQEDVLLYKMNVDELKIEFKGYFFGWGCGGANKIESFIDFFHSLGFKRIAIIYDGDKKALFETNKERYKEYGYHFELLSKDDIRDKFKDSNMIKEGTCDKKGKLKNENIEDFKNMINRINSYFIS